MTWKLEVTYKLTHTTAERPNRKVEHIGAAYVVEASDTLADSRDLPSFSGLAACMNTCHGMALASFSQSTRFAEAAGAGDR